jgi:hypothetical protein
MNIAFQKRRLSGGHVSIYKVLRQPDQAADPICRFVPLLSIRFLRPFSPYAPHWISLVAFYGELMKARTFSIDIAPCSSFREPLLEMKD